MESVSVLAGGLESYQTSQTWIEYGAIIDQLASGEFRCVYTGPGLMLCPDHESGR